MELKDAGLYCAAGEFYIDPWRPAKTALITHAHADQARTGSDFYFAAQKSVGILKQRLGANTKISGLPYSASIQFGKARVSFHPAGHILGSSQIRVEVEGEVWVFSGDYKRDADPTCDAFEVVECDTFITEATFGLPIYRWDPTTLVAK